MDQNTLMLQFKGKGGKNVELTIQPEDTMKYLKNVMKTEMEDDVNIDDILGACDDAFDDDTKVVEFFSSQLPSIENEEDIDKQLELMGTDMENSLTADDDNNSMILSSSMICAAIGCSSSKFDDPDLVMYPFPNNKSLCIKWMELVDRMDLSHFSLDYLSNHVTLCEKHFSKGQFIARGRKKKLKMLAMPDLSLPQTNFSKNGKGNNLVNYVTNNGSIIIPDEMDIDISDEFVNKCDELSALDLSSSFCRLCATVITPTDPCYFLFKNTPNNCVSLAEQINGSLPLSVKKTDLLPKQICVSCYQKLQEHYYFTIACMEAEDKLRKMTPNIIVPKSDFQPETNDLQPCDIKTTEYSCPLCSKGSMHFVSAPEPPTQISNVLIVDRKNLENFKDIPVGLVPIDTGSTPNLISDIYSDDPDEDDLLPANEIQEAAIPDGTDPNITNGHNSIVSINEEGEVEMRTEAMTEADGEGAAIGATEGEGDEEDEEEAGDIIIKTKDRKSFAQAVYFQEDMNDMDFQCDICDEYFLSADLCLKHCLQHAGINYYPCIVCGFLLDSEVALTAHFQVHEAKMSPMWQKVGRPIFACDSCGSQFPTRKDFIMHKCSQPKINIIRQDQGNPFCDKCHLQFRSESRNEAHLKFHKNGKSELLPCTDCDLMFELPQMLSFHQTVVHGDSPPVFKCHLCTLKFHCKNRMEQHSKVHTSTVFQCSLCNEFFAKLQSINKHMQGHGPVHSNKEVKKGLHCSRCGKSFVKRSHYTYHMDTAHEGPLRRMPSLIQYECKVCQARFTQSQDVLAHRTAHWGDQRQIAAHAQLPHICEYCGLAHASPNALARHRRLLHPNEHPYVCTICEVRSRTLYEARVHRKVHTAATAATTASAPNLSLVPNLEQNATKQYECQDCSAVLKDRSSWLDHRKAHRKEKATSTTHRKWFQCEHCPKTFPEKHRLIVHQRLHTGEKPFSCGVCGKQFSQISAMYTHSLVHTGELPHSCDVCGRKFRIKSDRDNHRRTHTGEKPYKCPYCQKTFRTGQVFYQHRMIHTDERRFTCDVCHRAFKRSHTLVCHRRIHTGEKPNICDICGKGFRQRTDMRKHRLSVHGVRS